MASNADPSVDQIQQDFQALLAYVTGPDAHKQTAYTVERTLFRRLLALGAARLRLFFLTRAATRPAASMWAPDGTPLPYHDRRPIAYYSIGGKLSCPRPYFYAAGVAGICPLDAELRLPARWYSDLLRAWRCSASTDGAYRETTALRERILGLALRVQAVAAIMRDAACAVGAFDAHTTAMPPPLLGTVLVAQADGTGVPMVQPPVGTTPVRLGTGQQRTKQTEAIVTALDTIAPSHRSPQAVVAALLHTPRPAATARRPRPLAKEVPATLEGKEAAMSTLAQRATLRDGPHIQARVALTAGAERLQAHRMTHRQGYPLVLDSMHASEDRWESATTLLGERNPGRSAWIHQHLEQIRTGQTSPVIAALEAEANAPNRPAPQVQVLRKTISYYQRNLPSLRYDVDLTRG